MDENKPICKVYFEKLTSKSPTTLALRTSATSLKMRSSSFKVSVQTLSDKLKVIMKMKKGRRVQKQTAVIEFVT